MFAAVKEVCLYAEPRCEHVDYVYLADYLQGILAGVEVSLYGHCFEEACGYHGSNDEPAAAERIAERLADARVRRINERVEPGQTVLPGEVEYEARRLRNPDSRAFGIVYDDELLSVAAAGVIGKDSCRLDKVNLVVTNQLIGTWEAADNRYHARTVYCGSPAIVSVPGLSLAPAREREYYLARQGTLFLGMTGQQREELVSSYAGDFLVSSDERVNEVLKGYLMQPVAYRMTGEPFCPDGSCRLYNAHWQREMIAAQLGDEQEYCSRHQNMFINLA